MNDHLKSNSSLEFALTTQPQAWIGIYNILFSALPLDTGLKPVVKAIQKRINVKADGKAGPRTFMALNQLLLDQKHMMSQQNSYPLDPDNEIALSQMNQEMVPFVKELIRLCAMQNIHIRILNRPFDKMEDGSFDLAIAIEIFEKIEIGNYIHKDDSPLYAKVAKLAESIGFFWGGHDHPAKPWYFELKPAWSLQLSKNEVIEELRRRKSENINLLT